MEELNKGEVCFQVGIMLSVVTIVAVASYYTAVLALTLFQVLHM